MRSVTEFPRDIGKLSVVSCWLSVRSEITRTNYFDSELSSSSSGVEGATEVEEREVTADAAGEVAEGAVAD
jgi:hypothetical protein